MGGLGLTGVIAEAELQLRRTPGPWLEAETLPFKGLDAFFQLSSDSEPAWEHTVSWIDCTSGADVRGLFMRANPTAASFPPRRARQKTFPFTPPVSLVNRLTLRALNETYYALNKRHAGRRVGHHEPAAVVLRT